MNKIMKTRIPAEGGIPVGPQKPLTEEEKRDLLIRQAEQKFGAIAEGVIMNICHNENVLQVEYAEGGGVRRSFIPAVQVVDYAFAVAEEFIKQRYGVTFSKKENK